jgi:hypothetical protein
MAQADYVVANGTGAAVRSDLNNQLAAIVSNNSGATEPATMYAYQWWADTTTGLLKLRNSANSAWISLRELDGTLTIEDGTAAAPGLSFASDPDSGIFSGGANKLGIATNGVERVEFGTSEVVFNDGGANYDFRIEGDTNANLFFVDASAEAVGIGSASFNGRLAVAENSAGLGIQFLSADSNSAGYIGTTNEASTANGIEINANRGSGKIVLKTNAVEAVRIDSSARLLVGTTSERSFPSSITGLLQVESTSVLSSALGLTNNQNTGSGPSLIFGKSRGASVGSNTVVQDDDQLGAIWFTGTDGSQSVAGAEIRAYVDGTPGANDMPGRIVLSTTANGASTPTERMRITSAGDVIFTVSPTSSSSGASISGLGDAFFARSGGSGPLRLARTTSNGAQVTFYNQGSTAGSITTNTTTTTQYNTSSDYRLKENIVPMSNGIDRLLQLKPSRFNFIPDPDITVDGFVAHEVQTIVPEAITGEKDAVDDEGNPVYQGIDQSKLVPLLTAALQEAITRIETLEAKVAALETP